MKTKTSAKKQIIQLLSALMVLIALTVLTSTHSISLVKLTPFESSLESDSDRVVCAQVGLVVTSDSQF